MSIRSQNELQRVVVEMRAAGFADWASRIESAQSVAPGGGGYTQQVYALARRCLWLAFAWNDHNFDAAHIEARRTAERFGIDSFDAANEWLEREEAISAAPASEAPNWQANMTDDDTAGKCCAFMGTERCSCGRAIEAKEHDEHCDFMAFSTGNPECTCKPDDFHRDGRDNKRQPQGTTPGSSPGYSRPSHHTDRFELDEGDRMTLRCALVSFSEELKRDGLGTDDHGVRMTAAYLARISRLLTRINNSAAECQTCNGLGIVGGVRGQTPESMEQVTENCPDCSDDVTAGGTSSGDDELPGMWSHADFTGGATDAEREQAVESPELSAITNEQLIDSLIEAGKTHGHYSTLRDSSQDTIDWWGGHIQRLRAALLRRAARVEVDEAMVERALVVRAMREDQAQWPDAYSEDEQRMERENMRSELCAALKVDGPSAYCRACQSVGMSNCAHFDECSGATCITCHRPLSLEPQK